MKIGGKPHANIGLPSQFPTTLLGLSVHAPSLKTPLACLAAGVADSWQGMFLANISFKGLLDAQDHPEFYSALLNADYLFPTGMPAHIASRFFGLSYKGANSHWAIVRGLMDHAEAEELRVFLIGDGSKSMPRRASRLASRRPGLELVGEYWISIEEWNTEEAIRLDKAVRAKKPHIVFASLTHIPAKTWLAKNARTLGCSLVYDLGASEALFRRLVYLSVEGTRQSLTLRVLTKAEILFRKPALIIRRASRFLFSVFHQHQIASTGRVAASPYPITEKFPVQLGDGFQRIMLPERFDRSFLHRFHSEIESVLKNPTGTIFDASNLVSFDMVAIATIVFLSRAKRQVGFHAVVQNPPLRLVRFLQFARMTEAVVTRYNESAAEDFARKRVWENSNTKIKESETIFWRGMVSAQTVDDLWDNTMTRFRAIEEKYQCVNVDLGGVTLLDSTGIGMMIKLKRRLNSQGYRLQFLNPKQNITRILRVTQLSTYLLGRDHS